MDSLTLSQGCNTVPINLSLDMCLIGGAGGCGTLLDGFDRRDQLSDSFGRENVSEAF